MELPVYHSPEVETYANAVSTAIGSHRVELASVLQDLPPETLALADALEAISGKWNPVELYTADNVMEEKAAFIDAFKRGESYVPSFVYGHAASFDVASARPALEELRTRAFALPKESDRDRLARITLIAKIDDDLATCDIAEGMQKHDDVLVARGCRAKYPGGDAELTAFTTQAFADFLVDPPKRIRPAPENDVVSDEEMLYLEKRMMTPEEQAAAFTWALKKLGIYRESGTEGDGFEVIVDPEATAIDVRDKSKRGSVVVIPTVRDEGITAEELCALIEHEIGAHARQAVNGKRLFKVGGGALRKDDETLYEGLAMRYEWQFGERYYGKVRDGMELIALYVFAVDRAEEGGSFGDIFRDQLDRRLRIALKVPYGQELPGADAIDGATYDKCLGQAWRTTYRVMRGHTDATNKQGFAMAKDLSYLRGWLMDRQLREKNLGHANEAAIMSADGLRSLGTMSFEPEDVPVKYQPIGEEYLRMILAQRTAA